MKFYLLPFFLVATSISTNGQGLTDEDREAILKKIEAMQEQAESLVDKKYQNAMSAFSAGMNDDDSALELYLKCEELINFEKKNKKAVDFRDWKKTNHDKFSEVAFKESTSQRS